jgi:REP-associated tyrosine transposase
VTLGRAPWLATTVAVEALREAFRAERARRPLVIDAIVIMPDHIHAVWSLPEGDVDYSIRWRNIKRAFTASIPPEQRPMVYASRRHQGEQAIWQRRFWEHRIRDDEDFARHVDYIHFNPVKHGYSTRPVDWPYSSIHWYIRQGVLTPDWGCGPVDTPEGIGHE